LSNVATSQPAERAKAQSSASPKSLFLTR